MVKDPLLIVRILLTSEYRKQSYKGTFVSRPHLGQTLSLNSSPQYIQMYFLVFGVIVAISFDFFNFVITKYQINAKMTSAATIHTSTIAEYRAPKVF